jgi:hypothetical protein
MSTDLVEAKDPYLTVAQAFSKMSELVAKNTGEKFGGAFVIVDPDGQQLESLALNDATPGLFWGVLKSIVEQQISVIDDKERKIRAGFGR